MSISKLLTASHSKGNNLIMYTAAELGAPRPTGRWGVWSDEPPPRSSSAGRKPSTSSESRPCPSYKHMKPYAEPSAYPNDGKAMEAKLQTATSSGDV